MSYLEELCTSLDKCPTTSHFIEYSRQKLLASGFVELRETEKWEDIPTKFFVIRDERQIFAINKKDLTKGVIISSHADYPCFKSKPNTLLQKSGCDQLRVAPYGNVDALGWMDRDLKIAGRVIYKDGEKVKSTNYATDYPVAIIPNLAVHMNRAASTSPMYNAETDFNAILCLSTGEPNQSHSHCDALLGVIADAAKINVADIIDFDLTLVDSNKARLIGIDKGILSASNISGAGASITLVDNFANAKTPEEGLNAIVVFDSNAIGGNTRFGVNSTLVNATLERIGTPASFWARSVAINIVSIQSSKSQKLQTPAIIWTPNQETGGDMDSNTKIIDFLRETGIEYTLSSVLSHSSTSSALSVRLGIAVTDVGFPVFNSGAARESAPSEELKQLNLFIQELLNKFKLK